MAGAENPGENRFEDPAELHPNLPRLRIDGGTLYARAGTALRRQGAVQRALRRVREIKEGVVFHRDGCIEVRDELAGAELDPPEERWIPQLEGGRRGEPRDAEIICGVVRMFYRISE